MNSSSCWNGSGGRICSSRAAMGRRWRSRNNGLMSKGGGGTDETQGVGGGYKIKGEEGRGCRWGASCLTLSGGTHSWRGTASNCYRGSDNSDGKGGGTDKKLADIDNVWRKETREDQDNANKR